MLHILCNTLLQCKNILFRGIVPGLESSMSTVIQILLSHWLRYMYYIRQCCYRLFQLEPVRIPHVTYLLFSPQELMLHIFVSTYPTSDFNIPLILHIHSDKTPKFFLFIFSPLFKIIFRRIHNITIINRNNRFCEFKMRDLRQSFSTIFTFILPLMTRPAGLLLKEEKKM